MMISNLPVELQNKIFCYAAEHPCAKMIRKHLGITEEDETEGYFCFPSNVLIEISNYFPGSCEFCKRNGRMSNCLWFAYTGDMICRKCLKDEQVRQLYYHHFVPEY